MNGFLNILKPPGMTSQDVVGRVRRLLPRGVRVGHGGTLDPDAAGVLPVCVGRATRLFDYIVDKQKHYVAELTLGVETDTQDSTGAVKRVLPVEADEERVREMLPRFTGEIMQTPPAYSAIKRDGKRLYDLARAGREVGIEPRPVTIYGLELLGRVDEARYLIGVRCGKGAYIRTLCHDIGQALGCGGHMSFLLRDECGKFGLNDAVTLEELTDVESFLLPPDFPLDRYPALRLGAELLPRVKNGNPVPAPDFSEGDIVRVYVDAAFAGMARVDGDGAARFKVMMYEGGGDAEGLSAPQTP